MNGRARFSAFRTACLAAVAFVLASAAAAVLARERVAPRPSPVVRAEQVTFEADSVLYADVSPDGRWLTCVIERGGLKELWLRSAEAARVVLPRRLAAGPGNRLAPAFAPDGSRLAYVSDEYDAKGDVFLLDLRDPAAQPARLTGRETEDGAPAFSPDGRFVYFHTRGPGEASFRVARLDAAGGEGKKPVLLDLGRDAAFPAISPDGGRIAFVSFRDNPGGGVCVADLASGRLSVLTAGPGRDLYPRWSRDGGSLYFSRIPAASGEGPLSLGAQVFRVRADGSGRAWPLTSAGNSALQPVPAGGRVFFLSARAGAGNIFALPPDGEVPRLASAEAQLALAGELAAAVPADPLLAVLANFRVREEFPGAADARAAYAAGQLYERLGLFAEARQVYAEAKGADAAAGFAALRIAVLDGRAACEAASPGPARKKALASAREAVLAAARPYAEPAVQARARSEQARLLHAFGQDAKALQEGIFLLDAVLADPALPREIQAEALFLRAELFARIGKGQALFPLYAKVLERFADVEQWADLAVARILDQAVPAGGGRSLDDRVQALAELVEKYRQGLPRLSAGAQSHIGDLLFAADEWARAKDAYRQVLERYPDLGSQTAAARLALAEILYREELFHQAIELYESEMHGRAGEDHLYRLARAAYLRKSLAAGEFLFRTGEIPAARSVFAGLLRDDPNLVAAHRGLIKCAAAARQLTPTLADYRARLAARPDDPVLLYAAGLCLTYLETKAGLIEARQLIERAVGQRAQVEYFHQTLGYVKEVLETVHGQEGGLEAALESYRKAQFLNAQGGDPENAPNLALNLGNVSLLLGQHARAFEYYEQRLASRAPFDNPDTELVFFRRLGEAAFQTHEAGRTVEAYTKALALIEERLNPRRASEAFGRINSFLKDRLLAPALRESGQKDLAEKLALRQAEINARLFEAGTRPFGPPPDPAFDAYAKDVGALLVEQEALVRDLAPLIRKDRDETVQTLLLMAGKVREGLRNPRELAEMRAELLDRLGLALHEAGRFAEARDAFGRALAQNERLGLTLNLAVNQRSAALAAYELAGSRTGKEREALLAQAAEGFRAAVGFVRRFGVPERKAAEPAGGALISLDVSVALDQTAATQALRGFSPEQEIRLCETYVARIETELGRVGSARASLDPQLAVQAKAREVADRDAYGVGLLFHRAGLLDMALRRPQEAFDLFARSAELALRLKNPVSAAANVENMAATLAALPQDAPGLAGLLARLEALDRRTGELLDRSTTVLDFALVPEYHNSLGVLSFVLAARETDAAGAAYRLSRAAVRFGQALKALDASQVTDERRILALWSGVLLNLARCLAGLGDAEGAAQRYGQALELARQGLLPRFEWRALLGLGRPDEALAALESVPLFGLGCGPGEITQGFSAAVAGLAAKGKAEQAFNLAERLSELERVHRLVPLFLEPLPAAERERLSRAWPRILAIEDLRRRLAKAGPKERPYVSDRLKTESELLERDVGADAAAAPSIARLAASREARDRLLVLLGLAAQAEDTAAEAVRLSGKAGAGRDKDLRVRYAELLRQYQAALALAPLPEDGPAGMLGVLAPRPAELVDVQESLPKGTALIRLFAPGGRAVAFTVERGGLAARVLGPNEALERPKAGRVVAVCEDVTAARRAADGVVGLSASEFLRALKAKKPFKRMVLEAPALVAVPPPLARAALSANATEAEFLESVADAHTLVLGGEAGVFSSAPTRPGERARRFLAADLPFGRPFPLGLLADRLASVSLLAFPGGGSEEAYALGHLGALFGAPTVLVAEDRAAGRDALGRFIASYAQASAEEALDAACGPSKECLAGLGFWGLSPDEAKALASAQFARSVRAGVAAHKEGSFRQALTLFENALVAAREDKALARHLPDLLAYARESAFGAGRIDRAAVHAQALADLLAAQKPDSPELASALLKLGLVLAREQRFDKAVPVLERALGILANLNLPKEEIAALSDLGVVLENAIRYEQALSRFESAAALSGRLGMRELLARQHMNIGRILDLRLARYAQARQSYGRGLAIFEALGLRAETAQALLDTGRCARLLGDFAQADELYRKALALLGKEPANARLAAKVLIEQANNAWYQARYQEAFDLARKVLQQARERGWPLEQEIALNTSGLLWWTLGDHERALLELDRALAVARSIPARRDEVATTLNNQGLVRRDMGRHSEALETLDAALAIDREMQSRWAVAHDLRNKALTYVRMNEPKRAVPLFEEALGLAAATGDAVNQAKILLGLGEALAALGREGEAAERFGKALELSRAMALRETEWRALHGQALGRIKSGRRDEAQAILSQAVSVIEGMRAELKMDQLKDGFVADKSVVYEALVGLLADMGRPAEAFEVAERSRARNLIDLLANRGKAAGPSRDRAFIERQNALRARIREQEALLAQAGGEAERLAYAKALRAVQDEHKDLLLEVQAANPELASLVSVRPLDLRGVQALLDKDQALLAYYVLDGEVLCWLVRKDSTELLRTPVGREGLGRLILTYRRMLQNLEPLERQSRELWDILLAKPLARLADVRSICIVPHGPLHYLSFATLGDGVQNLVERAPLYYAPSASVLKYTIERRGAVTNRRVLAVGNPDLGSQALDLPFAEREVAAMAWSFPEVTALTRGKATEAWVRAHIGEYGVIHLATHGEFDAVNPLFSALRLAKDAQFDGHLEAGDVFDLKLNADLVVLSACQTGLGRIGSGDDVVGMNRSFLYAGTHAVVSSLWRVSDISTAILMKQFYREYSQRNKAESLRRAMLHVKNRYPHPGYWGGFVLVGDFQ